MFSDQIVLLVDAHNSEIKTRHSKSFDQGFCCAVAELLREKEKRKFYRPFSPILAVWLLNKLTKKQLDTSEIDMFDKTIILKYWDQLNG